MFDTITPSDSREPDPPQRTSSYVRAIVRIRRIQPTGYGQFEVFVTPRTADWGLADWIRESQDDITSQLRRAARLQLGQAATFDVVLKPWSDKYWTDCGYEYDAGVDVIRSRALRCSRPRRNPR